MDVENITIKIRYVQGGIFANLLMPGYKRHSRALGSVSAEDQKEVERFVRRQQLCAIHNHVDLIIETGVLRKSVPY